MSNRSQLFKSKVELDAYLRTKVLQAQRDTLKEMRKELLKKIQENVYDRSESAYYTRTHSLLDENNWGIERVYKKGNTIYGTIEPHQGTRYINEPATDSNRGRLLIHNTHNSGAWKGGKLNFKSLLEIIENGLSEEHSMIGAIEPRPFWNSFLFWAQKNYSEIFRKNCIKYGVPVVKNTYDWKSIYSTKK